MIQRVSSNSTLFFKMFFPIGWSVFFAAFIMAIFIIDKETLPFLTSPLFKYPFTLAFLLFFFLFYKTFMQLCRVEMAPDYYIVSNYFKSYRLIYEDIESIDEIKLGRISWVTLRLKARGSLGNKISFLRSNNLYRIFSKDNPTVGEQLASKTV